MGLLSIRDVAERLSVSEDHVKALMDAGELVFIDIGLGNHRRPSYRFDESDVADYINRRRKRKDHGLCRSTKGRDRRSTIMNSRSTVVGFEEVREQRRREKQERRKPQNA